MTRLTPVVLSLVFVTTTVDQVPLSHRVTAVPAPKIVFHYLTSFLAVGGELLQLAPNTTGAGQESHRTILGDLVKLHQCSGAWLGG